MHAFAALPERAPASTLAALACLAIALLPAAARAQLAWDPAALAAGQWWRLWTAHFVHFGAAHALTDAIVLLALGALAEPAAGSLALALAFLIAPPLMSLALPALAPSLSEYRGASGLAVMLALMAAAALWARAGRWKIAIALAAAAFAAKTVAEACGYATGSAALPGGVQVAWQVHAMGGALGATLAAFMHAEAGGPCPAGQPG